MLVDSHCHLNFPALHNQLQAVVSRASKSGIKCIQTICTKFDEFGEILQIANSANHIFCSIGEHPLYIDCKNIITAEKIINICNTYSKVIGIGETGLDFYKGDVEQSHQTQSFIEHIYAAQETELPLIVHTRNAERETFDILLKYMMQKKFKAVIHCFTASQWFAEQCLNLGIYLSASGIVTFKNAVAIQKVFATAPDNMILIETDAPFLSPMPLRGKTNEPSYLTHTASFLSELRNQTYQNTCEITANNFFRLFSKADII